MPIGHHVSSQCLRVAMVETVEVVVDKVEKYCGSEATKCHYGDL